MKAMVINVACLISVAIVLLTCKISVGFKPRFTGSLLFSNSILRRTASLQKLKLSADEAISLPETIWMNKLIDDAIIKIKNSTESNTLHSDKPKWSEHPGFSYGLGCEKWIENDLVGNVVDYSCPPIVSWASKCSLDAMNLTSFADENRPSFRREIIVLSSPRVDIPHFRMMMSLGLESDFSIASILLYADYIPRVDIAAKPDYFDTFYIGIDAYLYSLFSNSSDIAAPYYFPYKAFRRLISSPTSLEIEIRNSERGRNLTESIVGSYVDKYCQWLATRPPLSNEDIMKIFAKRDKELYKVIFDDIKFNIAEMSGPELAPKAEETAVAMMGPDTQIYLIHEASNVTLTKPKVKSFQNYPRKPPN